MIGMAKRFKERYNENIKGQKEVKFTMKLNQVWLHAKPADCDICME